MEFAFTTPKKLIRELRKLAPDVPIVIDRPVGNESDSEWVAPSFRLCRRYRRGNGWTGAATSKEAELVVIE